MIVEKTTAQRLNCRQDVKILFLILHILSFFPFLVSAVLFWFLRPEGVAVLICIIISTHVFFISFLLFLFSGVVFSGVL